MQYFDRRDEPPPTYLQGAEADAARRRLVEFFSQDREKLLQSSAMLTELELNHPSVHAALNRLFKGKCAFCEAEDATETYRFRPATEATPVQSERDAHLYYLWLAEAWDNLYPICASCRPSDPQFFPVARRRAPLPSLPELQDYALRGNGLWSAPIKEKPLLIDPCAVTEVYKHIQVQIGGMFAALDPPGGETIEYFNLNRRAPERGQRLRSYLDALLAGERNAPPSPRTPTRSGVELLDFQRLEFGGSWYMLLRRLAVAMGSSTRRLILSPSRIDRYLRQELVKPDVRMRVEKALVRLEYDDLSGARRPGIQIAARRSLARLTEARLENFKAIESLELKMPEERSAAATKLKTSAPALLILGENAAGKSSILEAIAIALTDSAARDELDLSAESLVLNPKYLGAGDQAGPTTSRINLIFDGQLPRVVTIDATGFKEDGVGTTDLPPVFAYGAFRQFLEKQRQYTPAKHIKSLFRTDTLISNPEKWLAGLNPDRFAMVVRALRSILSIEGDFDVIERSRGKCYMVGQVDVTGSSPAWARTPLELVSSGFRAVLAMVCDIMQGLMDPRVHADFESLVSARAVVLIDEIEAHLHPRWKMQIMRGLREALPNVTFITTTHDPLCLRGMEDGEVRVLQRIASGMAGLRSDYPVYVEQLVDLPQPTKLTIEQLLTSDFFQLFSTDAPQMEHDLARMADLLAKSRSGGDLSAAERKTLAAFERDLASALPVGTSEVHRIVQDAVAEFLKERRAASADKLRPLTDRTRKRIVDALREA